MKRERPTTAAPRRIIEKEKVLTNMQEHLKHIQELEAERAAKHQEKRDKAKQKVTVQCSSCTSIRSFSRSERGLSVYTRSSVAEGRRGRVWAETRAAVPR